MLLADRSSRLALSNKKSYLPLSVGCRLLFVFMVVALSLSCWVLFSAEFATVLLSLSSFY